MKVSELMKHQTTSVQAGDSINAATKKFKEKQIRHLPVLDDKGQLIGIVTDRDLKRASASDATLLEIHELLYLLNKVKISEVMTKNPITVSPQSDVKSAAGLMVQNKVGCVPVVEGGALVGILTDTDILVHVANG